MDSDSTDSRSSSPNHEYISEEQSDYVNSSDEQEDERKSPVFDPVYSSDEQESPRKRMKHSNVDRITNLPDTMITHILSLMPVDEAVRTQLLSKRWRYAWASSSALTFSRTRFPDKTYTKINEFITNALMLHKGQLKSLSLLRVQGRKIGVEPPTNLWLQCAVNKQIEVLVLEIDRYVKSYSLPHCFLFCDSLKEFSLSAWTFDLGSSLLWKSLKKLNLTYVENLYNNKIHKIIEGSPELESFNLSYCAGFSQIIVSSGSKLRNLVIKYGGSQNQDDDKSDELLVISGPSIRTLKISGFMCWQDFRLRDVSSLVQVKFKFYIPSMDKDNQKSSYAVTEMIHELVRKISHVEKLSLGTWCTQVLSMCELGGEPIIPLKCKTLEIVSLHERSIPGIARLLRSSHYLERLTIDAEPYKPYQFDHEVENPREFLDDFKAKNYWKSPERAAFKNPWQHLKVVQFIGLYETIVELAEYVLDHAKVLEKLVLNPGESVYERSPDLRHSSLFQVMQKLLSYPRCSRHARVLLL
ncbi:F-box/LRR-repeat protein At3g26922-like [Silene latifolia]|uniref:F-box/LRR-repeat protein At3g26922-like n=1 Tax=Silene latifolia TaxID=37657 RepID=UPI003D76E502